ncbi:translation initiation factor IF-2 subunit gamma [Candidatus Woesearchaeota archaeon]|mgnify:CR=1 FL=1|jgi:translation initiation factor 2 subunit 3|nr:translation initiation factor IF-2 subunit gamma [Candidatus Woesearchaeota archaeon]
MVAKKKTIIPEINIGLVGHVDHGKTTLTEQLSGKWTDTHSEEIKRGITIRLGYADTVIKKCSKCKGANTYTVKDKCDKHKTATTVVRAVSFVDAPGHESLMATMLSGARIMDGALLLIAANEQCPQPQTREHLMGLQIAGIKNLVVIQNKIDLVPTDRVLRNYKQIKEFLKGTDYETSPIIPMSAQKGVNTNFLIEAIEKNIPTPKRDEKKDSLMFIARSFDINKPGFKPKDLKGGVLGGALLQGKIKSGDKIEIRPGRTFEKKNQLVSKPISAIVTSCMSGNQSLKEVTPGGSIALMTELDPSIVSSDKLVGCVAGLSGKLPPVWYNLILKTHLFDKVVGSEEEEKVEPVKVGEMFMLNVNSAATIGFVEELGKQQFTCRLKKPICAEPDSKVTISRRIGARFRLIGYGVIKNNSK